jgi:hypothetical protein
MKIKLLLPFLIILTPVYKLIAQSASSSSCNSAVGICSTSSYSFPAGVNAGTAAAGPAYGCLKTQPNPAWFFLQMQDSGSITFTMTSSPARDIDYIVWGPFNNPAAACGTSLISSKIVSCSYSTASTEIATIPNGLTGEYYIILITNYSNKTTNISFTQTAGTGSSNCDILCNITSLTAVASNCLTASDLGMYTVTGSINTFTPPTTGTLTVSSSCGTSVVLSPPFATSISYTLPVAEGHGDTCSITAVFSKVTTCSKTVNVVTPKCCDLTATPSFNICESQKLTLIASGTIGGTYHWSGPAGFLSTSQNPVISGISASQNGTYQVYLEYGGCSTPVSSVNVTVNPKPEVKSIVHH